MLPKGVIFVHRTASVVGDMRSRTICTFWASFFFVWTVFVRMSFTTHNTFLFFSTIWCLVPRILAIEHCWIEGLVLNSSTLKIMLVFWHINLPEISASTCFGLSHFILIKGRSLPVQFFLYFIFSTSSCVILLKQAVL